MMYFNINTNYIILSTKTQLIGWRKQDVNVQHCPFFCFFLGVGAYVTRKDRMKFVTLWLVTLWFWTNFIRFTVFRVTPLGFLLILSLSHSWKFSRKWTPVSKWIRNMSNEIFLFCFCFCIFFVVVIPINCQSALGILVLFKPSALMLVARQ